MKVNIPATIVWALIGLGAIGLYFWPLAVWPWYLLIVGLLGMLVLRRQHVAAWLQTGRKRPGAWLRLGLTLAVLAVIVAVVYGGALIRVSSGSSSQASVSEGRRTLDAFGASNATRATAAPASPGGGSTLNSVGVSSGSAATRQQTQCFPCNGTGTCRLCDGKGRIHIGTVAETDCPNCLGDGICPYCNGTGFLD